MQDSALAIQASRLQGLDNTKKFVNKTKLFNHIVLKFIYNNFINYKENE